MSSVPEWFERLKAEWPAAWVYEPNDGDESAVLTTPSGIEVRVWGGESAGEPCHGVIDTCEDEYGGFCIFVDDLCGMTFAALRESVGMAVSNHLKAWQEVAALVGGES